MQLWKQTLEFHIFNERSQFGCQFDSLRENIYVKNVFYSHFWKIKWYLFKYALLLLLFSIIRNHTLSGRTYGLITIVLLYAQVLGVSGNLNINIFRGRPISMINRTVKLEQCATNVRVIISQYTVASLKGTSASTFHHHSGCYNYFCIF